MTAPDADREVGEPVLPDQTTDDTDAGWGERYDDRDADARLLADRPPHWDR